MKFAYALNSSIVPQCRSPRGERGLKLLLRAQRGKAIRSLPPRGAWIEMCS